jgi:hypothetical protein
MTFDDLNELFKFDDYKVRENKNFPNINLNEALLIAIHHSGDSGFITKKLHLKQKLSVLESFYVKSLTDVISKLPRPKIKVISRNEIEDERIIKTYQDIVNECLISKTPLINLSFWNFTENINWPLDRTIGWKVTLAENTRAGVTHNHYYPVDKLYTDELEVIFPPNSKFSVSEYSENIIHLLELE